MLLAIDIGNTHTVAAVFDGATLVYDWRIVTADFSYADAIREHVSAQLSAASIDPSAINAVGISSVVPAVTAAYAEAAEGAFGTPAMIIDGSIDLGIAIQYDDPKAVGADRICNAVAGYAKYGGPLIIVDFGTATTYDLVASNGDYLGGVIAPGVETSAADLHRRAARLPRVELTLPSTIIARDTVSSMQAGILYGAIDATQGMVQRLRKALTDLVGSDPIVVGTGGFSSFISTHADVLDHVEPHLVLEGIRLICEKQQPKR